MSYKGRKRKAIRIAQEHEWYESPSGNEVAMGGEYLPPGLGSTDGVVFLDARNTQMYFPTYQDDIRDYVDWDAGGVPGQTKFVGYEGPVTGAPSGTLAGQMAVVRTMPVDMQGPVGADQHNSLLQMLYAMQESSAYLPNEVSQADIIKAV